MSGALGLSPDVLNNLGNFLASVGSAANQRTPGGFLANPSLGAALSAGTLANQQYERQIQESRAKQALLGAQTGQIGAQTELTRLQVPFMMQRLNMMNRALGMAQGQVGAGGGYVPQMPEATSAPGAIPPENRAGLLNWATQGTPVPPALLASLVQQESGWNPEAVNSQSGAIGLTQILPSTAQQPGMGVPGIDVNAVTGAQNAPNNLRFAAHYLTALGQKYGLQTAADWSDPQKLAPVLNAYGGQKGPSAYAANIIAGMSRPIGQAPGTEMPGATPRFVPPGMPTPQEAMAQAQRDYAIANAYAMAGLSGNSSIYSQQGNALQSYALGALKNIELRQGGMAYSPAFGMMKNPELVKTQTPTGQENYGVFTPPISIPGLPAEGGGISPLTMGQGSGPPPAPAPQGAQQPPAAAIHGASATPAAGMPAVAQVGPATEEFQKERGEGLAKQFQEIDEEAAASVSSNFLFDQMRADSNTWNMNRFAPFVGDARSWLQAAAQSFNVKTPDLDKKVSDYQSFIKSSGILLREAVHETSSRAAVQEYRLIGETLPTPATSKQAFNQIADQWQGLNDYRIAKQKFAREFDGHPKDFGPALNANVSPTSFMLMRMQETPEGQQDFHALVSRLQTTSSGRLQLAHMMKQFNFALQHNLFEDLPPMAPQQAAANVGQP